MILKRKDSVVHDSFISSCILSAEDTEGWATAEDQQEDAIPDTNVWQVLSQNELELQALPMLLPECS